MAKKRKEDEGNELGSHSKLLANGELFSDDQLTEEDSKKGSQLRSQPLVNPKFYFKQDK